MKRILYAALLCTLLASCDDIDYSHIAPIEEISGGAVFGTAENPLDVGGPNQPNQVYADLSGAMATAVPRESWDLGFYSGDDFKIILNGSVMMAAKQLETNDITLPQQPDFTVAVGTFNPDNMEYVDSPDGSLSTTALGEIATSEATAHVFLLNLGNRVPVNVPAAGSVNTAGESRGWLKVKVWQQENGYALQYAALDAATPGQVHIDKEAAYNFTFFSFTSESTVHVEPEKNAWDIAFTTFTNEVFDGSESAGAYFYADYILLNSKAGVRAVKIDGDAAAYDAFTTDAFTAGNYQLETDQRAIGADWRDVFTHSVFDNVFFVVQDGDGVLYKLKFISMLNADGERGYPVFQYTLLQ